MKNNKLFLVVLTLFFSFNGFASKGLATTKKTAVVPGITLTLLNTYNISSVPEPSDLTYDKVNNQLFSVSDTGNIFRLSVTGQLLDTYTFAGDLEGVSMSGTPNTLIVAIEDTYKLVEYNYVTGAKTTHTMSYTNKSDPGSGIEGVTYNALTGEVYFLNEKSPGALIVANSSYSVTNEYPITFAGDYAACDFVDESGFLWIGSDQESSVYKCTTNGTVIQSFNLGTLDKLEGIAIDYDNQLLYVVTDGDAKLYVYKINDPDFSNIILSTVPTFTSSGGTNTVSVTSSGSWSVSDDMSWITVSPTSGSGNDSFVITTTENTSTTPRTGTVTITGSGITKTISIKQNGVIDNSCASGTNVALNATVSSYSSQQDTTNKALNINDGNTSNRWSAEGFPQNIVIDLGSVYNANQIVLFPYSSRDYQFLVEGSTTSATTGFSTLVDARTNTTKATSITKAFSATDVRYVKLTITGSATTQAWSSINELQVLCSGGTTLGIQGLMEVKNNSVVFSNPFSDTVEIITTDDTVKKLNIYDLTGALVFTTDRIFSGKKLDLPNIANGLYLFQFLDTNNQVIQTSKAIKGH